MTDPSGSQDDPRTPPPPRVPGFRVLELIGHGGMGDVWLARQDEPIRREVAIKVIRGGCGPSDVLPRFEVERQALAVMDHPNIAKILDAGTTEGGRPFFAMELVRGVPILEYCDRYRLGVRERIELFQSICLAVQHAHQKGVIHRDLKPSNLLVAIEGDEPVPKVIDFGIAKAVSNPLTDQTLHTEAGAQLGTPRYMSPEQANPTRIDVDTRTDVYSLGVVLFELLSGTLPYESRQVQAWSVLYTLENQPMPRPSARFWAADDRAEIAVRRSTTETDLRRHLRGDLDWVILRAAELDRTRRYETPTGLSQDLQRHLSHEPVTARPPSWKYRAEKFIKRNRTSALIAGGALAALLVGLVATVQALQATREAERTARAEAGAFESVATALAGVLAPDQGLPEAATAEGRRLATLQKALRVSSEANGVARERLNRLLAKALLDNGFIERAIELYEENIEILEARSAPDAEVAWARAEREVARTASRRPADISRAVRELRDRALPILDSRSRDIPVAAALVHLDLADLYEMQDSVGSAADEVAEAIEILRAAHGPEDSQLYGPLRQLARLRARMGDLTGADSALSLAIGVLDRSGGSDAEYADLLGSMGDIAWARVRDARRSRGGEQCAECRALVTRAVDLKYQALDHLRSSDFLAERAAVSGAFGIQLSSTGLDNAVAAEFLEEAVSSVERLPEYEDPAFVTLWYRRLEESLRRDGHLVAAAEVSRRREAYSRGERCLGGPCRLGQN